MTPEFPPPRTAIVTGAARRIGRALAEALNADGWHVLVHCNQSLDEAASWTGCDPRYRVAQADLAYPDASARVMAACAGWPAPGLLVNNASRFVLDDLDDFTADAWNAHLDVNLRAPALLTQAFAAAVPDGAPGLVVNLLDAKLAFPNPDYFTYTVSKMGLAGLTELCARRLAGRGIRVNGIAPSVTLVSGPQSRADFEAVHRLNALGRGVAVNEIVAALRYLVATPTVTGEVLTLDGGQRLLGLTRDVQFLDKSGCGRPSPGPTPAAQAALPEPDRRAPASVRILLEKLELDVDIGFHAFEVGTPQRILVTVEVELDAPPPADDPADAWDYDRLRTDICALASSRRWNLQESLARAIWDDVMRRPGVRGLRVATRKPDIYADAEAVGVELSSSP